MTKKHPNNDTLHRFLFDNAPVRGEYIKLTQSFGEIINQHTYPELLRKVLGEALCVAGLLSAILKFDGRLTVQFQGKGKLSLLLAQCDNNFNIRGLAKYEKDISHHELLESLQDGILAIMLDPGKGKQYQGMVTWRGNSFAESIEGYFRESEQLNTKIKLAVDGESAAGYLLQVVPDKDNNAGEWERITNIIDSFSPDEILHESYEEVLKKYYPQDEIRVFNPVDVAFGCTCSLKRSEEAVMILGREEAEAELESKQMLIVTCDFCNREYVFDRGDVEAIFASGKGEPPTRSKH
jgi:molecular chaperone Hsp33